MKRRTILQMVPIGGVLAACGRRPPPQPPRPSPSPSPVPQPGIAFPLKTSGTKFVDSNGKPIWLSGSIECCESGPTKFWWPLTSREYIDLIAANGGNYVHIRLGPITKTEDPSQAPYTQFRAYATDSRTGRANIDSFNQKYFDDVDALIKYAASKGVIVEVSLLDAWSWKEGPNDAIGHPWLLRYSIQPFNDAYANQLSKAPHKYALALLDKAVKEWGDNPNVIWEISNESGVPGKLVMGGGHEPLNPIPAWEVTITFEQGVVNAVRAAELKYGYPKHLIGTNSERQKIEKQPWIDYVNRHERFATKLIYTRDSYYNSATKRFEERPSDPDVPATKPVMVNEYPRIVPTARASTRSRELQALPYVPRCDAEYAIVPDEPTVGVSSRDRGTPATSAAQTQVDLYKLALERALERGTYFQLWRGNFTQSEFLGMLAVLKEFKRAHNLV